MIRNIFIGLFILFLIAQFFRPSLNKAQNGSEHYQDIKTDLSIPNDVHQLMIVTCYDCHSNHTRYPWYDKITPVNFWVTEHINHGKEELNFSEFHKYTVRKQDHKLEETAEMVKEQSMPLKEYLYTHTDARLSENQRQLIIHWADSLRSSLDYDKSDFSQEQ